MCRGSVPLQVALSLRPVLADKLSASMPSYADVVLVCAMLLDIAFLLRLEIALLTSVP